MRLLPEVWRYFIYWALMILADTFCAMSVCALVQFCDSNSKSLYQHYFLFVPIQPQYLLVSGMSWLFQSSLKRWNCLNSFPTSPVFSLMGNVHTNACLVNSLRPRQMDAISQTTFPSVFSWMKMYEFRLKFHWSLFLRVQLIIFQHWFR